MGYWKEKERYEQEIEKHKYPLFNNKPLKNCTWCGSFFSIKGGVLKVFKCQGTLLHFLEGSYTCEKCCEKCKKCGKYFCPKHIDKHKCKV